MKAIKRIFVFAVFIGIIASPPIIAIGGFFNTTVISANGGKMPATAVVPVPANDLQHCLLTEKSRLPLLADVIIINYRGQPYAAMSIVDILIIAGRIITWTVAALMITAIIMLLATSANKRRFPRAT